MRHAEAKVLSLEKAMNQLEGRTCWIHAEDHVGAEAGSLITYGVSVLLCHRQWHLNFCIWRIIFKEKRLRNQ